MTNEEKAYEISQSSLIEDGIWHYATAELAAIMMAEWKDQQFKEYLEREKAERERVKTEMIDKACNVFCHTGCPHKTDFFNCLGNKCETWKIFKRMMEE